MKPAAAQDLKADFAARGSWFANRTSAIFPLRLRPGCDLILVYLNYWSLKNRIELVQRNVRLFDESGTLRARLSERVEGTGCSLSMRECFGLEHDFDGMVEIEFIALDNLVFPFPAVQAFYRAGDAFSSVHSGGRVKNPDEPQLQFAASVESNWICKFSEGISPFFHVFTGCQATDPVAIEVSVLRPDNTVLATRTVDGPSGKPFGSRLLLVDQLLDLGADNRPPQDSYCRVAVPQVGIFPRLVVGNLHHRNDFLEVTHSFAEQHIADFVAKPADKDLASFIPAPNAPGLNLRLWSFPTNCAATTTVKVRRQSLGQARLEGSQPGQPWTTGGAQGEVWRHDVAQDSLLTSIDLTGDQVPSRLNVSYQFSVAGVDAPYSTDIATGAKSCVYPPKHSHWGSSVVGAGFRTVLMARNMSHNPHSTQRAAGTLRIWTREGHEEVRQVAVEAEAVAHFEIVSRDDGAASTEFVHWLANFDQPSVELFWVSYAPDGRICGDHAF